jgi:hypothetical protein
MNPTDLTPDPPERDLCDELLAPPAPPSDLAPLREQILRRTTRRLRWRRRLRRLALVAALAACWAGGMLTMRWLSPTPAAPPPVVQTSAPSVETLPPSSPIPTARALEWKAIDSDKERAALSIAAGDAYLKQEYDPLSAVRCYGRSLDAAPEQVQTSSTDDEWLLMAIKDARKKEKRDAKTVD